MILFVNHFIKIIFIILYFLVLVKLLETFYNFKFANIILNQLLLFMILLIKLIQKFLLFLIYNQIAN